MYIYIYNVTESQTIDDVLCIFYVFSMCFQARIYHKKTELPDVARLDGACGHGDPTGIP